jgi:hypothetical protein
MGSMCDLRYHPREMENNKNPEGQKGRLRDEGLGRFARAFKSEADLWGKLAELFRRMGRERVRITHGVQEHGRDIVFYGPGGLGTALYACVVKNDRITGEAGSSKSVRTVIDQAKEAFQYPYLNPDTGQEEQVRQVFVLSPFDCSPTAQESISAQVRGYGAVEFCCGSALLDLFSKHWQSFFIESNVLASYLTALRAGLQNDAALIRIILQKPGVLANIPADFEGMYVQQAFGQTVHAVSVGKIDEPLQLPERELNFAHTNAFLRRVAWLKGLVEYAQESANAALASAVATPEATEAIDALETSVRTEWSRSFQEHSAKALANFEKTFAEAPNRAKAAPPMIRENSIELRLERQDSGIARNSNLVEEYRKSFRSVLSGECAKANGLKERYPEDSECLLSTEFRAYCGLLDLSEAVPEAISFGSDLRHLRLDALFSRPEMQMIVISGPAGFGKSSFCRSQALSCAEALLSDTGHSLPVMVPLHKFTAGIPGTADEAFFDSPELRVLLESPPPNTRVLLFLDGLDEVPNAASQRKIIELARKAVAASHELCVIVTARDHIVGPWLNNVPRVNVLPLSEAQQLTLAERWLGSRTGAQAFFEHLQNVSPLRRLMEAPLLATLILAVYKKQGFLPPNRTALYDLFIELLCGGWDAAKEIQRHDRFGIHDKRLVLVELAGRNHLNESRDSTDNDFRAAIRTSLQGLLPHSEELLIELRHDGLLVTTGSGVRFRHLSFQEYLASEFLHGDQSGQRAKPILRKFYGGEEWWRNVLDFYVTRTSNPTSMEDWLIQQAGAAATSLDSDHVQSLELDRRLTYLRRVLREAFPSYSSKHPEDGIVSETIQRGAQIIVQRRTLSGVRID